MIVRQAGPADAEAISALLLQLGYAVSTAEVAARAPTLAEPVLVADRDGVVVGLLTWHATASLHRPGAVGRITAMVVEEAVRGLGVGRALVQAAETRMRAAGCILVEVASNMRRKEAHAFYERLGYDRSSYKFAKGL